MSKYIIGDIHGCADQFQSLLDKLSFNPSQDELFLAGDLVGRGAQAKEVLDLAMKYDARFVLGNFDLHFIACAEGYRVPREDDNFDSLMKLPKEKLHYYSDWLAEQPFYIEEEGFVLAHASLHPLWTLEDCRNYGTMVRENFKELRRVFKGSFYIHALQDPEIAKDPDLRRGLEILLTFVICRNLELRRPSDEALILGKSAEELILDFPQQELETFTTVLKDPQQAFLDYTLDKGLPVVDVEKAHFPWFNLPQYLEALDAEQAREVAHNPNLQFVDKEKALYFGHWSYLRGQSLPEGVICTDTSCVYGCELSAYKLPEKIPSKAELKSLAQPYCQVQGPQRKKG